MSKYWLWCAILILPAAFRVFYSIGYHNGIHTQFDFDKAEIIEAKLKCAADPHNPSIKI